MTMPQCNGCCNLDWSNVDQTKEHHPECSTLQKSSKMNGEYSLGTTAIKSIREEPISLSDLHVRLISAFKRCDRPNLSDGFDHWGITDAVADGLGAYNFTIWVKNGIARGHIRFAITTTIRGDLQDELLQSALQSTLDKFPEKMSSTPRPALAKEALDIAVQHSLQLQKLLQRIALHLDVPITLSRPDLMAEQIITKLVELQTENCNEHDEQTCPFCKPEFFQNKTHQRISI